MKGKSIAVVMCRSEVEQLAPLFDLLNGKKNPPVQLLFHTGAINLVAGGSPILKELRALEENGVHLLACSTCLSYAGLRAVVGKTCSLERMMGVMETAGTVIAL